MTLLPRAYLSFHQQRQYPGYWSAVVHVEWLFWVWEADRQGCPAEGVAHPEKIVGDLRGELRSRFRRHVIQGE